MIHMVRHMSHKLRRALNSLSVHEGRCIKTFSIIISKSYSLTGENGYPKYLEESVYYPRRADKK